MVHQVHDPVVLYDQISIIDSLEAVHQGIEVVLLLFLKLPYVKVQHKLQFMACPHVLLGKFAALQLALEMGLQDLKRKCGFPVLLDELDSSHQCEGAGQEAVQFGHSREHLLLDGRHFLVGHELNVRGFLALLLRVKLLEIHLLEA